MALYQFVSYWHIHAPLEAVWDALDRPELYHEWWPAFREQRNSTPGVVGVGARHEQVVRGWLPYDLRYEITITDYNPPEEQAYSACGDLEGSGRFVLFQENDITVVTFYWDVTTKAFWLNLLDPIARPLFAWNHNYVMRQGERGLSARLTPRAVAIVKGKSGGELS